MNRVLLFLRKYSGIFCLILLLWGGNAFGQIVTWEVDGLSAYGPSPFSPTISDANVTVVSLTRGTGITTAPTAASNAWGGNGMNETSLINAVTNNDFVSFSITANSAYAVSLSEIPAYNIRRSATGATSGQWQYRINSGIWTDIGTPITWGATTSATGNLQAAIDLSSIAALQNVPATSTINFRIVLWGASTTTGTWYLNNITGNDLAVNGTITSSGKVSASSGDWNTASTWSPMGVPGPTDNATITAGHIVYTSTSLTRTASTTVNGTFELRNGGFANGTNFTYGAAGTLNFNTNDIYGVSNTHVYWPTTSGPVNVNVLRDFTDGAPAGFSLNNAPRTIPSTGTLSVRGADAANLGVVQLSSSVLTINGKLQINSSGTIDNPPTYTSTSTVEYNNVNPYTVFNEWNSIAFVVGLGVPQNVTLINSTVNMPADVRGVAGNLTIDASSTLNSTANGALILAGNWNNAGVFNANDGVVSFRGNTNLQTITNTNLANSNTESFSTLIVAKTGVTTLQLESNINVNGTVGNVLRMLDTGPFNLNGKVLSLNNDGGDIFITANRTITSSVPNGRININGQKKISNNAVGQTLTLSTNVTVKLNTNGVLDFGKSGGSEITILNGTLSINSNTNCFVNFNPPIYGSASALVYNTPTYNVALEWTGNAAVAGAGTPQNVTLTNSAITMPTAVRSLAGNLNIGLNSTLSMTSTFGADLQIGGNFTNLGTFNGNDRAIFFTKNGTQTVSSTTPLTIPYVVFQPTTGSTTVQLLSDVTISAPLANNAISFNSAADVLDINGSTLKIGTTSIGNLINGLGTFKGSTTSNLTLLGTGSIGTVGFTSGSQILNNLTIDRTAGNLAVDLVSNLSVNGMLTLTSGILNLGSNTLTMTLAGTISGGSASSYISVTNDTGRIRKNLVNGTAVARNFTFPIGNGTAAYTPATIDFSTGNFNSAFVSINVANVKEPNNVSPTHFINRYWNMQGSGITNATYSFSGDFLPADIAGGASIGSMKSGRYRLLPLGNWIASGSNLIDNKVQLTGMLTDDAAINSSGGYNFTAGNPFSSAEINIKPNVVPAITTASGGSFDFGTRPLGSSTAITFTIENSGLETLNLGVATLTNSSATNYSLTQNYTATVNGNGTTTFIITFAPTVLGTITGSISIPNSDVSGSEAPYVINFNGIGGYSNLSDIITAGGESNTISSLVNTPTINTATDGVEVWRFTIRDGGASLNDLDIAPTILNSLTVTQNSGNEMNDWADAIQSVALFNGSTKIADGVVSGAQIVFSGSPLITVTDNTQLTLSMRMSVQTSITNAGNIDNEDFVFSITDANSATATGSQLNSFSTATSVNGKNVFAVVGTQLAFLQQPTSTSITVAMTPAVTVIARDINGNQDLDSFGSVNISSSGTLTGTPSAASPAGIASFNSLTHTVAGIGYTLNATATGLNGITSTAFDISTIIYVNGDWLSKTDGNWFGNSNETVIWFKRVGGSWVEQSAGTFPSGSNDTYTVFIEKNINIVVNAANYATGKMHILAGGKIVYLKSGTPWTFRNIIIDADGTFQTDTRFQLNSGGNFEIKNGGNFIYNYSSNALSASTGQFLGGNEIFHPNSNFIIKNLNGGNFLTKSVMDAITPNGSNAYFGNLIVDYSGGENNFTLVTSGTYVSSNFQKAICNDLIFRTSNNSPPRLYQASMSYIGSANPLTIQGNLNIESTFTQAISFTTSSHSNGSYYLNVKKDFIHNGALSYFNLNSQTNNTALYYFNIDGNVSLGPNAKYVFRTAQNSLAAMFFQIKGNLTVASTAEILDIGTDSSTFGNFWFIGSTTPQLIDFINQNTNIKVNYAVRNGAEVKLINQNFNLGSNSKFTIESGGTLDFGFNTAGTTALNVSGTSFQANTGSALKITSPAGITTTGNNTGNVQTSTRTFANATPFGNYEYIGKSNQATGNALPITVNNLTVNNETVSNDLTLSQGLKVQGTLTTNSGNIVSTDTNLLELGTSTVAKGSLGTTNGFVKGPMKRWFNGVNSGNASGLFPLGSVDNKNRHALIEYTTAPTAGALTAKLQGTMGLNGLFPPLEVAAIGSCTAFNVLSTDDMYWGMTASDNLSGGLYDVTIKKENSAATETDICKQTIVTGTNLTWGLLGTDVAPTGTPTNITLKRTGINAIKDVGIGRGLCKATTRILSQASDWTDTPPTILDKIKVTGNYTIPSNTIVSACECEVDNNVTLTIDGGATLAVAEAVTIGTDAFIDIKNNGSLVQYRNVDNVLSNNNTGNIKMERISKPMLREDYTYWSSPVQNFALKIVSPGTSDSKFFKWKEDTQVWSAINPPSAHIMEAGRGYIVRAPSAFPVSGTPGIHTANFIGVPNNGVVTMTVKGSVPAVGDDPTGPDTQGDNYQWNLIGNPYPSAIDADIFMSSNSSFVAGTLYLWTHNTPLNPSTVLGYAPNDYASWNGTGGVDTKPAGSTGVSTGTPNGYIAAGQSLFIRGITAGMSTVTFNNSMRVDGSAGKNSQFFRTAAETAETPTTTEKHRVWLNLTGAQNAFNQTLVGYVTDATNAYDLRFDGESFGGNKVTFYSVLDTKNLVIQGRALPFSNLDTVPLGYSTTLTGNLTISIDHVDGLMETQGIYLQDNLLNVVHNLKASNYTFATVPGTFDSRFVLRYSPQEDLSNPTFNDQVKAVKIYKNKTALYANSPYEEIATVAVYDIAGRLIFEERNCNTNRFETTKINAGNQALIIKVTLSNGAVITQKVL